MSPGKPMWLCSSSLASASTNREALDQAAAGAAAIVSLTLRFTVMFWDLLLWSSSPMTAWP